MLDIVIGGSVDSAPRRMPNCLKCIHFKVSWDAAFPRACEVFGLKSKNLPSADVFYATGSRCPSFCKKEGLQ